METGTINKIGYETLKAYKSRIITVAGNKSFDRIYGGELLKIDFGGGRIVDAMYIGNTVV